MNKGIVCITGGLGFIGTHLVRKLRGDGFTVRVIDNLTPQIHGHLPSVDVAGFHALGLQVIRGDILDSTKYNDYFKDVEYFIHLAAETGTAQSMYEIAKYNGVNSQGTALLLDWLMNHKHSLKKVILASSRSIYGEGTYVCQKCGVVTPDSRTEEALSAGRWDPCCPTCAGVIDRIATAENAQPKPASIYAATKLAQEDLVRIACGSNSIPFSILRFQNVYGQGQSLNNPYTGILSVFSTRIRRGMNLPIFEDGLESRDFVHVSDVVHAIELCLEQATTDGQVLNVGSGVPTSVIDVAEMLVRALKGRACIETTGQFRLGDIRHCFADISTIQKITGFQPKVDLEDGLAAFAKWVSSQPLPEDGLDRANRVLIEKGLMK